LRQALLFQESGRDSEALQKLNELAADKQTPALEAALANFGQASLLQRTGKLTEATKAYETFLKNVPEAEAAKKPAVAALIQSAKWTQARLTWLMSLKGPGAGD